MYIDYLYLIPENVRTLIPNLRVSCNIEVRFTYLFPATINYLTLTRGGVDSVYHPTVLLCRHGQLYSSAYQVCIHFNFFCCSVIQFCHGRSFVSYFTVRNQLLNQYQYRKIRVSFQLCVYRLSVYKHIVVYRHINPLIIDVIVYKPSPYGLVFIHDKPLGLRPQVYHL